ncbi:MAG TPA: endonuclease III [Candidatus Polarisedimenticolaceae bacterium]|nr:endonuclease III [Candidatus Polarisedimenticolaceae bacterium]
MARGAPGGRQPDKPDPRLMHRVMRTLAARYEIDRFLQLNGPDPYRILVGCVISLRTKDEVSYAATARLFARARTPAEMIRLRTATVAELIYPAGFYNRKAKQIREISRLLTRRHAGRVPDEIDELLALPGVGRKTANLVVTLGFGNPGICVDTHVHRITNRLGWVATDHPDRTEFALRESLPRRLWIPINETLVRHGQQVCRPVSPLCSRCPVASDCARRGVERSR